MKKIISLLIILASILFSCESVKDTVYRIDIENQSTHTIQYYISRPEEEFVYPNTSLPTVKKVSREIKPSITNYDDSGSNWEVVYKKLPSDKMSLFIFDSDTLKKYNWENVRLNYRVLKRYDLTLKDLEDMNWTVTYTGN
ncbi:hypothetical protein [Flavobacterium sp. HJJ]|uniref:hypothetical protein n=1 Tax=Flavobacterium sp. HJJ TaxID=2783792 RepID=UPI00188B143A|nr:hypothetical protein [Flavobacterium sp. HJJ]MBF4472947.1 hypothetical protein [Flavobacterium sp. HJJ]